MKRQLPRVLAAWIIVAAASVVAGCSATGVKQAIAPTDESSATPERSATALKEYDARRDGVQYQAALAFFRQGNLRECRAALEQILGRSPESVDARLLLCELDLYEQNHAAAAEQLDMLPAELAGDPRVLYLRGLCHEAAQRPDLAEQCWTEALSRDPHNPHCRAQLELLQSAAPGAAGIPSTAPTAVADRTASNDQAAYSAPIPEPRTSGEAVQAATAELRRGNPLRAAEIADKAVGRFPASAELYRALGVARHCQGQDESAEVALRQALSLDKAHPLTYFFLGATLERRGQHSEAAGYFRRAAELDPRYQRTR